MKYATVKKSGEKSISAIFKNWEETYGVFDRNRVGCGLKIKFELVQAENAEKYFSEAKAFRYEMEIPAAYEKYRERFETLYESAISLTIEAVQALVCKNLHGDVGEMAEKLITHTEHMEYYLPYLIKVGAEENFELFRDELSTHLIVLEQAHFLKDLYFDTDESVWTYNGIKLIWDNGKICWKTMDENEKDTDGPMHINMEPYIPVAGEPFMRVCDKVREGVAAARVRSLILNKIAYDTDRHRWYLPDRCVWNGKYWESPEGKICQYGDPLYWKIVLGEESFDIAKKRTFKEIYKIIRK